MRPDRIVVGECRGGKALDMLQATNTGHDDSLTTIHANSPFDMVGRLEAMVMFGAELSIKVIRSYIASAVDIIIQINRLQDGSRKVVAITEILDLNEKDNIIDMQDIFLFNREDVSSEGKVLGIFISTGIEPNCLKEFKIRGIEINENIFNIL